ncbi:MAG: response regulator [Planctomycetes bacterium]|nr:response regulator [Planctomycetota bacterium]
MLSTLYSGWDIASVEALEVELRRNCHRLISTYKLEHALFHVHNDNVDLCIIDYDMDVGLDCLRVLREIRAFRATLPIVVLTSHNLTKESLRQIIRNVNNLRIIRKPFDAVTVVKHIEEMVQHSEDAIRRREKDTRGPLLKAKGPVVERRMARRKRLSLPMEFYVYDRDQLDPELYFGKLRNVSESGFLFHTVNDIEGRHQLRTALNLGGGDVMTDVEVVRTRELRDRYEVAVRFMDLN